MFENERNIFDNDLVLDLKNENGNSIVEATFVVTITIFLIATIIMLGFYHYQITLLQTVADEVSTQIARTYAYENKDPITGFIGSADVVDHNIIESSYWVFQFFCDTKQAEAEETQKLTRQLLSNRRFMAAKRKANIDVDIRHSELLFFQNEIEVTVSEEYYIPFAQFLGVDDSILKVKKSSKAICVDIMGANGYYQALLEISKAFGSSEIGKMLNNISGIFKAFGNSGKNLASLLFTGLGGN